MQNHANNALRQRRDSSFSEAIDLGEIPTNRGGGTTTTTTTHEVTRLACPCGPVVKAHDRHVHQSVTRSVAGVQTSARAHTPTEKILSKDSYAHDEQGDDPGQEKEGSAVFSINCDRY